MRSDLRRLTLQVPALTYQRALTNLGSELGQVVRRRLGKGSTAVVTTPEDADFLTKGLIKAMGRDRDLHLVCYWTTRFEDTATVHKQYVDPSMPRTVESVVIAKSIISSGCIVRTNLEEFLALRNPKRIFIVAPVMLRGADDALRSAFAPAISKRFDFVSFATDTKKTGAIVTPGVGGVVERRLGLSGRLAPALIKEWRARTDAVAV